MSLLIRNFTNRKIGSRKLNNIFNKFISSEKIKGDVEVSLVFVGEKRMRGINRASRGIDKSTDVLSFEGDDRGGFVSSDEDAAYIGEIFICIPKAIRQAKLNNHSVDREIGVLLVHGLYHLLGYDHIEDEDYVLMDKKEKELLKLIY